MYTYLHHELNYDTFLHRNFLKIYTILQLEDPCPPAKVVESVLLKFGPLLAWKADYVVRNADCVLRGFALYGEPWHSCQREAAAKAYKDYHDGYKVFSSIVRIFVIS